MNILLPQTIESEAVERLEEAGHTVVTAPDPKPETVLPLMKNAHAVILRTGITMTRKLIEAAADLKVISRTGGGFDNVDVKAATDNEVIVTSNLGVNSISVCEHVLAMMLSLAKQLPLLDRAVRNDNYSIRYQNLSRDLNTKTIGLLGFGRIGVLVAISVKAPDAELAALLTNAIAEAGLAQYAELAHFVDKEQLCRESDVISVHVPLTEQTRHALSTAEFELMKSGAIVINTSRGPVIDEEALVEALRNNVIGGAGLDVQSQEPPDPESPLLKLDKVLLTPHSAALTTECVTRMATEAADRTLEVLAGKKPLNVANPEVLAARRWQHLA